MDGTCAEASVTHRSVTAVTRAMTTTKFVRFHLTAKIELQLPSLGTSAQPNHCQIWSSTLVPGTRISARCSAVEESSKASPTAPSTIPGFSMDASLPTNRSTSRYRAAKASTLTHTAKSTHSLMLHQSSVKRRSHSAP